MNDLIKKAPQASIKDVLKLYWKGMKPLKWYFIITVTTLCVAFTLQVVIPLLYKQFFDILTTSKDVNESAPQLINTIVMVLVINLILWVFFRIGTFVAVYFQSYTMANLRNQAFDHMIDHSYTFFANNFTGSLTQRVNRYARSFDQLIDQLLWNLIPIAISLAGMCIVLWRIKPIITYMILVWTAVFMIANFYLSRWKNKYNIRAAAADSRTTGLLSDDISNQNTIALFTGSIYEKKHYAEATLDQANIAYFSWSVAGVIDAVRAGLIIIMEFILFYYSIRYWQAGAITVGTFVLIQIYFIGLGDRLWGFSRIIRVLYEGFADAKEMVDIMLTPHEIKDVPGARELVVSKGEIKFNNVEFSFNETRTVLNKINIDIKPEEKVAVIGPSGAGKSTFVRLILRMYETAGGSIEIDGQNIHAVTQESLRKNVSLVPQDPVLFHRSLMENIRYGKRDATDEEVIEAAKLAHCDEFIDVLPLKYETFVGERGIKLSGGERQRVAIARAILKNAPILILDEATSSLDSQSEMYIQDALDVLMKNKTVIVIAHRLSTIRKMDRIIVLENGEVLEEGSHDVLLQKEGSLYQKLWNLQAGGFMVQGE